MLPLFRPQVYVSTCYVLRVSVAASAAGSASAGVDFHTLQPMARGVGYWWGHCVVFVVGASVFGFVCRLSLLAWPLGFSMLPRTHSRTFPGEQREMEQRGEKETAQEGGGRVGGDGRCREEGGLLLTAVCCWLAALVV